MIDLQQSPALYPENAERALGTAWGGPRRACRHADAIPRPYSWPAIFLGVSDVTAAVVGLWLAHFAFTLEASLARFLEVHWRAALALPALTVVAHYYFDTYSVEVLRGRVRSIAHCLKAAMASGVLFLLGVFLLSGHSMSRAEAVCAVGLTAICTVTVRALLRDAVGFPVRRVLIVGTGPAGQEMAVAVREHPGYLLCGFLDETLEAGSWTEHGPVLGRASGVSDAVERTGADLVVIAEEGRLSGEAQRALRRLEFHNVGLMPMPRLYEMLTGRVATRHLGDHWYAALGYTKPDPLLLSLKRVLDTLLAGALLLAAAPFMLLVGVLVRLTSPGPVFYSQERVGLHGRTFRLWKFRSMRSDAEKGTGPVWATKNDPRVTPLGRIMRKTRIDELPQLWNVLRGDMSLTGPRPERPMFVARFAETIPFYEKRLAVRPGLTGWAQVMHRYDESEEDVAVKLQYDLFYIKHWSLLLDLQIWIKTIATILTGSGAH